MKPITKIIAATAFCIPMLAFAQTVTPPDQPRTNLEKQQTTQNGQATKYGGPGTDAGSMSKDGMSNDSSSTSKSKMKHKDMKSSEMNKSDSAPPAGGASTYPAPTRDGTPTSPSTTK